MKTFIFLVGISLALASPGGKVGKPQHENEFVIPEKQYPEVITKFDDIVDYSTLPIEQLLQIASEHQGLEFLSDANATAAMGIDISTLSSDIVSDALATTVRFPIFSEIFIQLTKNYNF